LPSGNTFTLKHLFFKAQTFIFQSSNIYFSKLKHLFFKAQTFILQSSNIYFLPPLFTGSQITPKHAPHNTTHHANLNHHTPHRQHNRGRRPTPHLARQPPQQQQRGAARADGSRAAPTPRWRDQAPLQRGQAHVRRHPRGDDPPAQPQDKPEHHRVGARPLLRARRRDRRPPGLQDQGPPRQNQHLHKDADPRRAAPVRDHRAPRGRDHGQARDPTRRRSLLADQSAPRQRRQHPHPRQLPTTTTTAAAAAAASDCRLAVPHAPRHPNAPDQHATQEQLGVILLGQLHLSLTTQAQLPRDARGLPDQPPTHTRQRYIIARKI